jgi:predicted GNAT family acetyltransferase
MADSTLDGPDIEVVDNSEGGRFEVWSGGTLVGRAVYRTEPGKVVFTHTEVDPALQGHGIAQMLAARALDEVRASGRQVVPLCPFVASYIRKHPEYADLVVTSMA